MYNQAETTKKNDRTFSTDTKKSNNKYTFSFVDNRPQTVLQRKIQNTIHNNSKQKYGSLNNPPITIMQLAETDEIFRTAAPSGVKNEAKEIYLLEGNEKYGLNHLKKHSKELSTVAYRRGWTGKVEDILQKVIENSMYSAYSEMDGNTCLVSFPITCRNRIVIPIAEDGKIITAMVKENDDGKGRKMFWKHAPSEVNSRGWDIVHGKVKGNLEDAPWDLYSGN